MTTPTPTETRRSPWTPLEWERAYDRAREDIQIDDGCSAETFAALIAPPRVVEPEAA